MYMFPIAGQTTGPNGLTFLVDILVDTLVETLVDTLVATLVDTLASS